MVTESISIEIRGYSDDMVAVESRRRPDLEQEAYTPDQDAYVELSTGDVIRVRCDEQGCWRVTHHVQSGKCELRVDPIPEGGPGDDGGELEFEGESEVACVRGPIGWVEAWQVWPPTAEAITEKLEELIGDGVLGELSEDDLRQILRLLRGRA